MVSQVLANAILNSKAPDIVGEFQRGQEIGRQGKARELAGAAMKAGGGEDLEELYNVDPELAYTIGEKINARSAQDINNYIRDAKVGLGYLNSNDVQGFLNFGQQRLNSLRLQGRDISNTQNIVNMVASGDVDKARQLMAATVGAIDKSKETASISDFKFKTEGLSEQEKLDARRVNLGLKARAGESAQERIARSGELTSQVAGSQAQIKGASSGASEAAKLSVQGRLLPEVQKAVELAKGRAQAEIKNEQTEKGNSKALKVYETAISGLTDSFGLAKTGPAYGLLPAIGADDRVLESAIKIMGPVLKGVVREAGEGTFSDGDRAQIDDLMPNRSDSKEAAIRKIEMLDNFVRAKLDKNEEKKSLPPSTGGIKFMGFE